MRRLAQISLSTGTIAILLYAAWHLLARPGADQANSAASLVLVLLSLGAAAFGAHITLNRTFSTRLRRAWGLITLALIVSVIADALWAYFDLALGVNPFPSLADVFYLATYVFLTAGVLSLPYAPLRPDQRRLFNVDLSLVVLACGVFLWHFVLSSLLDQGLRGLPVWVSAAYPLGDLLILAGLITLIQQDVQGVRRRILNLLAAGVALTILADILFALNANLSAPVGIAPMNLLWLGGRWAVLAAAILQAALPRLDEAAPPAAFSPLWRTNLLYGAVLAGMGLAFIALFDILGSHPRLFGTVVGALLIALLVLLRQYLLLQDNRRLHAALAQQAITDALTGLANRRRCDEVLALELRRAERYRRALSVLMLDVDNFKHYNDRHGHLKGDMLLRVIAGLLREQLRASDTAARYGGDEFVILLPETNAHRAAAVVDKLHAAVRAAFGPEDSVSISISIGCAAYEPGQAAEALLAAADQAMYRAKPAASRAKAAA